MAAPTTTASNQDSHHLFQTHPRSFPSSRPLSRSRSSLCRLLSLLLDRFTVTIPPIPVPSSRSRSLRSRSLRSRLRSRSSRDRGRPAGPDVHRAGHRAGHGARPDGRRDDRHDDPPAGRGSVTAASTSTSVAAAPDVLWLIPSHTISYHLIPCHRYSIKCIEKMKIHIRSHKHHRTPRSRRPVTLHPAWTFSCFQIYWFSSLVSPDVPPSCG